MYTKPLIKRNFNGKNGDKKLRKIRETSLNKLSKASNEINVEFLKFHFQMKLSSKCESNQVFSIRL